MLRESRGLTLTALARLSGMSESGIRRIEKSGKPIRESSLSLILSAIAAKEPVSVEDQIWLSQLTGLRHEDIRSMCQPKLGNPEHQSRQSPVNGAQNLVYRLQSALDTILASGAEVEAIELLESIARWSVASRHAIDEDVEPIELTPREREAIRAFRVTHPHRTGEIRGAIIQDFTHYEVDEDGNPTPLTPNPDLPKRASKPDQSSEAG